MSENKVLSSTDVWDKRMFRILCGTCTEIYMAETDTSPHPDCPSVPHDEESGPADEVSVSDEGLLSSLATSEETKVDFVFGED